MSGSVSSWDTGLVENLAITNTGSTAVSGWNLALDLPAGQTVTSAWNAAIDPPAGRVTARNVEHNGTIAPGTSTSFGFQATHTGDVSLPTGFSLDGTPCTTA
ncbi:cellulose binding domain-containing protein [Kitasatospora sp. NPDC058444]|uniref:cellulose binding domain-containing protein n=1 Tax=Kitasatospora sp. NPDC058444 TaxID=3346504 RepID=UPI00365D1E34